MLNMLGSIHQIKGNPEDDKKSIRILKSQRRAIFAVMILVMIIDISDLLKNETNLWRGLFSGGVLATCIVGLFVNLGLSKRIGTRIKKNLD